MDEATRLRQALRILESQISGLLAVPPDQTGEAAAKSDVLDVLRRVSGAGGRLHKLELHQVARESGVS